MGDFLNRLAAGFQGFANGLRSPGTPMQAVEPPGSPPSQFDYPYGYNITSSPRADEPITFAQLRELADGYDLLRLAIEKRKNQIEALDWNVVPINKKDPQQQRISNEVYQFLKRPDKVMSFGRWLRALVEDILVIDAPAISVRRTRGGGVYSLDLVDGATIKRNLDETGRTPLPPYPAYQQILSGLPAIDLRTDELLYMPRNQRTHKVYGYGNVEQIVMTVNIAIRRQLYQLGYYTEGNIPEAFISCPESWGLQQVLEFQAYWDSLFNQNANMRRRARFIPNGTTPTFSKENPIKDQYDEWLARIVSYCLDLPPTSLVKETNRATAETTQDAGKSEGVASMTKYLKELLDILIQDENYLNCPGVEFVFMEEQAQKPLEQAQVNEIYSRIEVLTTDEIRQDLGHDPLTDAQKAEIAAKRQLQQPDSRPNIIKLEQPSAADWPNAGARINKNAEDALITARLRKAELRFSKKLNRFFDRVRPDLLKQLEKAYQQALASIEKLDDETRQKITALVLDELNFDGWAILFDDAAEALAEIAKASAARALAQVRVTDKDITKLVDEDAVHWANSRAAEMIGKKYIDGELVDNPNPKWAITESTRESLRSTVSLAVEEGWSPQKLSKQVNEQTGMWPQRADTIAVTELAAAHSEGNLIGWKASGVVAGKRSLFTGEPDATGTDPCPGNAMAGVIGIDEKFPSGHEGPPYHPNCRCVLLPVVDEDQE